MNIKSQILKQIHDLLDNKINEAKKNVGQLKESRNTETKSSAGDKYETGRVMMQFELEKNEVQLGKFLKLKNDLQQIEFSQKQVFAELGSLVVTNQGNYFLSVGIGKVDVENTTYYVLSPASPIGKLLYGRKEGENFTFNNKKFVIKSVF